MTMAEHLAVGAIDLGASGKWHRAEVQEKVTRKQNISRLGGSCLAHFPRTLGVVCGNISSFSITRGEELGGFSAACPSGEVDPFAACLSMTCHFALFLATFRP